jgi:uncharacterized membrane protein (DUF2068 family)
MGPRAKRHFPGTAKPRRFVPRLHYELLVCGIRGHELIGTDTAHLEPGDDVLAREIDGVRWYRCLRCDSWLPLGHPAAPTRQHLPPRDQIKLPLRGRPLRDKIVLRLIAIDRALHFVLLALLSVAVFLFAANRTDLKDTFYRVVADFQGAVAGGPVQTDRTGIVHELDRIFTLKAGTLHAIGIALAVYALLEGLEAVGLWMQKRWAEYLTLVVTASLLPLEFYEFINKQSPFKVSALIINTAIVIYLLYAKRLFGIRGGAAAEEAAREADVGWHALEANAPETAPAT